MRSQPVYSASAWPVSSVLPRYAHGTFVGDGAGDAPTWKGRRCCCRFWQQHRSLP